jgi:hypothetical protein
MGVQNPDPILHSSGNQKPLEAHPDNKNQLRKTEEKQLHHVHTRHQTATTMFKGTIPDRNASNTTRQWPSTTY